MSPPPPEISPITGTFATLEPRSRRALVAAWLFTTALLVAAFLLISRPSTVATRSECEEIFERLVTLELTEMGYRDPVLASRQQATLSARFADSLEACVGQSLPDGAMDCVATAATAEDLSHHCLR